MKQIHVLTVVIGLLFFSTLPSLSKADAENPDHQGYCFDSDEATLICERFIEGFLEGALLTDAAIMATIEKEQDSEPSFTDRAIKTRIGSRIEQPTELAGFCLPEKYTVHAIAKKILAKIENPQVDSDVLGAATYTTLKTHYRCDR